MAIGDISLTASARSNLMSLQNTAKLLGSTQEKLSTGKKVNTALDNATSYFQSQGFLNSANDLATLKDGMATALQTIKAASDAIESISAVVKQLQSIVTSALQTTDSTTRAGLATQYNALLSQLDDLANDATFNGTNLVNSLASSLEVNFNATNTTNLTVEGTNLKSSGMGLGQAQGSFAVGSRAEEVTNSLTVSQLNQTASGVYAGTLNNLTVTGTITGTGVGAEITSSSGDFSNGALVTLNSTGAGSTLTDTSANFLGDQLAALVTATTLTLTDGTAVQDGTTALTSASIRGSFSVTGGTASTYNTSTNTLTVGDTAATTLTVAAGQSIKITYNDGGAKTATYTNQSNSDAVIVLSSATAADTVVASSANSTATYSLTGGTVDHTGLTLSTTSTFGGSQIVDSAGAGLNEAVTIKTTTSGAGDALGTTSQTGVIAYDMDGVTVSNIASTEVTATVMGGAAAVYSATGADITVAGAKVLTGSSITVVADALSTAQNQLTSALTALRTAASSLGNNNSLVQTRSEFTSNLINTLQTASDNLTLADTNEEGANLQTLQAQNQLGIVSLGISGQLAQSVLKLF